VNQLNENSLTDKIGMWVFLATEVCFFIGLFMAFLLYRQEAHEAFHQGAKQMNIWAGAINTALLLTSSFFIVSANWSYKKLKFKQAFYLIIATILFGATFLIIKIFEYAQHIHAHLLPGYDFQYNGKDLNGVKMYFTFYYIMTGLHALHLIIGLFVLIFIAVKVYTKSYNTGNPRGLELAGLYWHFVDIIWIFLFPLLYLVDRI
jgi:cytochrome c oxidase subunit 3